MHPLTGLTPRKQTVYRGLMHRGLRDVASMAYFKKVALPVGVSLKRERKAIAANPPKAPIWDMIMRLEALPRSQKNDKIMR